MQHGPVLRNDQIEHYCNKHGNSLWVYYGISSYIIFDLYIIYKIDIISNRIFYGIFCGLFSWGILGSLVVQYFDVAIGMIHGFTFNHLIPIARGVPISGSEMTYRGRSSHFVQGKWASFFTGKGYHGLPELSSRFSSVNPGLISHSLLIRWVLLQ